MFTMMALLFFFFTILFSVMFVVGQPHMLLLSSTNLPRFEITFFQVYVAQYL